MSNTMWAALKTCAVICRVAATISFLIGAVDRDLFLVATACYLLILAIDIDPGQAKQ